MLTSHDLCIHQVTYGYIACSMIHPLFLIEYFYKRHPIQRRTGDSSKITPSSLSQLHTQLHNPSYTVQSVSHSDHVDDSHLTSTQATHTCTLQELVALHVAYERKGAKWKEVTDTVTYLITKNSLPTYTYVYIRSYC